MPHPNPALKGKTLCGREGGSVWVGGYYETYPQVTCKNCKRVIPAASYNRTASPYRHFSGAYIVESGFSYNARELGYGDAVTWFPARDGDPAGILAIWNAYYEPWCVAYNEKGDQ